MRLATSECMQNPAKLLVIISPATTRRYHDGTNFRASSFQIVIDDHEIIFTGTGHLLAGTLQTAGDGLAGVLPPFAQAPFEILAGGRNDKDRDSFGQLFLYL